MRRSSIKHICMIMVTALLLLVAVSGGLIARYIASNTKYAEMISSSFHFSGEYLEETAQTYVVTNWDEKGIAIPLYNYQKTNTALVSEVDISYEIQIEGDWECQVYSGDNIVKPENGVYTMQQSASGEKVTHILYFLPKEDGTEKSSFTVTVTSTKPYKKALSVKINADRKSSPEWIVTDKGNYLELVIKSNSWSGPITVQWDAEKFSPDNQNTEVTAMKDWSNNDEGLSSGSFYAAEYSTYTLIFFDRTVNDYGSSVGSGETIKIGGA